MLPSALHRPIEAPRSSSGAVAQTNMNEVNCREIKEMVRHGGSNSNREAHETLNILNHDIFEELSAWEDILKDCSVDLSTALDGLEAPANEGDGADFALKEALGGDHDV